jgi:hypothetical protein
MVKLRTGLVAAVMLLGAAACSDDAGGSAETTAAPTESSAIADAATTTEPSDPIDTTAPPPTTTELDAAGTTTSVPVTTATTLAEAATTTAPVASVVLEPDGVGVAPFGRAADDMVAAISAVLGPPTAETEWMDSFSGFGTCPGTEVKGVSWGDFTLLLGDDTPFASGNRHGYAWFVGGGAPDEEPQLLVTDEGIGLGSTVAQVKAAYSANAEITSAADQPELGVASFSVGEYPTVVSGTLTGTADTDIVTSLEGGAVCGE